jgi:cytoskeleton protein RodZ
MRQKIDIAEVEAATKIRAKYLRALENEEWDLLPGPTFVKTFLRTYADYLGLDARNLVEQYRASYERPSAQELAPFGARRRRPRRPILAPWMMVVAGVIVLVAALYFLGRWGDEPEREATAPNPSPTVSPGGGSDGEKKKKNKKEEAPAKPTVARLQIQPTGPVSVCLENAAGDPLIQNVTLQANQDTETFRSKRFRVSFGTPEAVMRVDGKAYQVSQNAPIGYEIRAGGKPKAVPESERPTCSG